MSDPDLRDPRLDQAYRELPGEEPSPEVDKRIRAAARRAVGARPQSLAARERSWVSRWRVPLSLAASVVVVVTLAVMMQEEEQRVLYREAPTAPAAPAPATVEDRAAPRAAEEVKRPEAEQRRAAPPPAPARSALPAPEPTLAPAATPMRDAATPPPPQVQKLEQRQDRHEESPATPASVAPMIAPAAKPAAAPSGASDSLSRERAVGERPAREMRSAPQVARPPEEWIEQIRRLKAQGRGADAAAELAEFRRRHPEYPLPADLAR